MVYSSSREKDELVAELDGRLSVNERRVLKAVQASSGRIRIAPEDTTVSGHLVVIGSEAWFVGNVLPDELCSHTVQFDPQGVSRCVVQPLAGKHVISQLFKRRFLQLDTRYMCGNVFKLSDRAERLLQREAECAANLVGFEVPPDFG